MVTFSEDFVRPEQPERPLWKRILFAIPVLGWVARDVMEGDEDNFWYLLVALLSLWVIAIMTWGLPALYLPAVFAAPVCIFLLICITQG